ncbi:uncharacterized protein K452DRAFT_351184 [Aplosporella prunicola CBS 121167]|uniref:Methyltransferase domain-containing protein n=1 Tax=Aplosporella prunicola CBS 121167 TaxID=1176127 RepID=A0A6A6BC34_9PEZI|nr:uncharacterized protein K452DRAFT_351184 [Aplosporella prunicola CBS 121167]KAF2141606.1 hypothetical protein K452DRAFT_351184 [Aplosporella prunicola CBS 121167]
MSVQARSPTLGADVSEPSSQGRLRLTADQERTSKANAIIASQASSSSSITSSILDYTYENGRRYHAFREGKYFGPNDEREQNRMDLFHHISTLVLDGRLFNAPLRKDPKDVLDFGTGTGIWAIDFADEYPDCNVIGTDLSPIQSVWVPPNCHFLVDDVEAEWDENQTFDFVHGRTMSGCIKDWSNLYAQTYKNLNPGGWVEIQEFEIGYSCDDDSYPTKAPTLALYIESLNKASEAIGRPMNVARHQKQWMTEAGFVNVTDDVYEAPMGPWTQDDKLREVGKYTLIHVLEAIEAYCLALFTRVLDYRPEEVQVMMAKMQKEYKDPDVHINWVYHVCYGQKPESA